MSIFNQHLSGTHSTTARILGAVAHALRAAFAVARAIGHRGDVRLMLEMDERSLKDVGLTRNDVLGALAQPLIKDPSAVLMVRSIERRARSRARAVGVSRGVPSGQPLVQTPCEPAEPYGLRPASQPWPTMP